MALVGWRLLRPGTGSGVVLSVDFTLAQVRAQANFANLACGIPDGYEVWGTDESGWPVVAGDPHAQLEEWVCRATGHGMAGDDASGAGVAGGATVRAVLGFCAGASLAVALADRLGDIYGTAPEVVLYNPVTVSAQSLLNQFDVSLSRMAAVAGEDAIRAAHADLPTEGDLYQLAPLLAERYAAVAGPACAAQGIPPSIADQLCQRVAINLRYMALCAVAASATESARQPALVVVSGTYAAPPPWQDAPELRLEVAENELLAHPDAARAAAGVLAGDLSADRP